MSDDAPIDIRRADGTEVVLRCPVCMRERRMPVGWEEIMRQSAPADWDGILRCQNDHDPEPMQVLP